jgi:S1-C subfamily serine protease
MNYNHLCERLDSSTYLLNIYQDEEYVGTGTGVCINSNGDLITAAHVIYGRFPASKSDTENLRVFGKGSETKIQEYEISICGVSVNNKEIGFSIDVDLALLKNTNPNNINYNYLPLTKEIPVIGDNILMSGFLMK